MTSRKISRVIAMLAAFSVLLLSVHAASAAPPQRIIVKYRAPSGLQRPAQAQQIGDQAAADVQSRLGVRINRLRVLSTGADVMQADRELTRAELDSLIESLRANPNVEYAEEDKLLKRLLTPNDSRYSEQWHYFEATAGINAPTAWDSSTGTGVTVAVVDTGVRPHADLAANLLPGYDFISDATVGNDGNARDSDASDPGDWTDAAECDPRDPAYPSSWHGSHVAGTIAARTNNSVGVAGVAFNAKVVPIRVLGRCGGFTSDIADGIVWASGGAVSGVPTNANPAKLINISLGGPGSCGSTLQSAINTARGRGTALIVAAG
ncbi:MAG TPA: S8 family serine peptidase, partial [Steroidobacteraceae bacterium]|nr:S8 family serine peptidase [Steroidobacteraceae bacterium]